MQHPDAFSVDDTEYHKTVHKPRNLNFKSVFETGTASSAFIPKKTSKITSRFVNSGALVRNDTPENDASTVSNRRKLSVLAPPMKPPMFTAARIPPKVN